MGRKPRVFVEGGVYHVYCRTARGERAFEAVEDAAAFVEVLREVKERDGFLLCAWCLMGNHYHLALRSTRVPLWRSMASIHVRVSKSYNQRKGLLGPLWQTRYRAKIVMDQRYLEQLILYIHLNPVAAGVVQDPADYSWSGHLELLGNKEPSLVDVDETLQVSGERRAGARRAYSKRLAAGLGEDWAPEDPGKLRWWGHGETERMRSRRGRTCRTWTTWAGARDRIARHWMRRRTSGGPANPWASSSRRSGTCTAPAPSPLPGLQ